MNKKLFLFLTLIFYKTLIFYLSSQPIPPNIRVGKFDYLLHIVEYFPLGILWSLFLFEFKAQKIFIFSFIFSTLYALCDEIHQVFVPERLASWQDFVADVIGISLGIFTVKRWLK